MTPNRIDSGRPSNHLTEPHSTAESNCDPRVHLQAGMLHNEQHHAEIPQEADKDSAFDFERLPAEVKNMIYRELLILDENRPRADQWTTMVNKRPPRRCWPAILATSSIIHKEATSILYGDNTFEVEISHGSHPMAVKVDGILQRSRGSKEHLHPWNLWPMYLTKARNIKIVVGIDDEHHATHHTFDKINHTLYSLASFLAPENALKGVEVQLSIEPGAVDTLKRAWLWPLVKMRAPMRVDFTPQSTASAVADIGEESLVSLDGADCWAEKAKAVAHERTSKLLADLRTTSTSKRDTFKNAVDAFQRAELLIGLVDKNHEGDLKDRKEVISIVAHYMAAVLFGDGYINKEADYKLERWIVRLNDALDIDGEASIAARIMRQVTSKVGLVRAGKKNSVLLKRNGKRAVTRTKTPLTISGRDRFASSFIAGKGCKTSLWLMGWGGNGK